MALTEAVKEGFWLKKLVNYVGLHLEKAIVFSYSESAIFFFKGLGFLMTKRSISM